jgi:hypothetical protein
MTPTRFETKLANIKADPMRARDFIICDAKDSDMGFGLAHAGPAYDREGRSTGRLKSRAEFLDQIRALVKQDVVDLMLLSVSNLHRLAIEERIFDGGAMGTAIRANDTTDAWALRGAAYAQTPSLPFRTAEIAHAQAPGLRGADIGLYSVTFNNEAEADLRTLEAFRDFRRECEDCDFPYFLEVFNPNKPTGLTPETMPYFVNDAIVRCLAAVPPALRPKFLKVVYNGPRAMEELAGYDPGLIVGVLGGGSGTTHDCLKLLHDARKYGARVALFGRKINLAEDPLGIVLQMRRVADGDVSPQEGVRAYHDGLGKLGVRPLRPLADDLVITDPVLQ